MIRRHLDNGIDFIYIPIKTFYNSVSVGVRSGYSYDPDKHTGLTHLYEHVFVAMLSKLNKYSQKIEKYGFSQNASTYNGAMIVYFEQYKSGLINIFNLFKKNIEKFMVDGKDFNIEKESVKNETSDWNKNYDDVVFNFVKRRGFSLPRNKRVDTQRSVDELNLFDLLRWHNYVFSSGNVVVVLYGKVSNKEYTKIKNLLSSIEIPQVESPKKFYAGKYNTIHRRHDTGVLIFNVKNPTFKDYLCERIYKNTMVDYDDSLLFNFVRNKERLSYGADYNEIDGVGERVFYFSFTFKDKSALRQTMKELKYPTRVFKQDRTLFEKGKKRALIEFYKDASNQSDFAVDLAYYYLLYGEKLDMRKINKYLSSLKYNDYEKWLKKLTYKKLIV